MRRFPQSRDRWQALEPNRWARLRELFEAAARLPAEERPRFLDEACADDPQMRDEAESLLRGDVSEDVIARAVSAAARQTGTGLEVGREIGHYRILDELGTGGMGEVYLVEDRELGRRVALKALRGWRALGSGLARRFRREARVLASLNHPNIVTIHSVESEEGLDFITMELVDGPTLADRIATGPMPPAEAVDVARQIGEALQAAHAKGVIHRDLKPANIKLTAHGRAKVLDFGLAKPTEGLQPGHSDGALSQSPTVGRSVSEPGLLLGTASYMSPEQARGQAVDGRTDVWAFGCVLFEMLSGARAFSGKTVTDVLASVIKDEPPWEALPESTPSSLRALLRRCLEKDPSDRLHDIADVQPELRDAVPPPSAAAAGSEGPHLPASTPSSNRGRRPGRAAWVVAGVLLLGGAAYLLERSRPSPAADPSSERVLLAVLPFDDLSGDPGQEYLSDGMTEEMIAQVGTLDPAHVGVIGRASAMRYKGTTKRADEIGRELGVAYILSGSVRRSGARLRVTAELVRTSDQVQVWSGRYDRHLRDVIELQSEVARAIVAEMPVKPEPQGGAGPAIPRSVNPGAYESYLQGRYFWNTITPAGEQKAIEHFERAVAEDPDHAPAWAWLGSAITLSAHLGATPPREAMVRAREAIDRALALDPASADAHVFDGWLKLTYEWEFEAAARAFRRSLVLNPSLASGRQGLGLYLAVVGRVEEALEEVRRARELDPLSVAVSADECLVLYYARRYDEALEQCKRTLEMDPDSVPGHLFLARVYEVLGQHEQAMEASIRFYNAKFSAEPWLGELEARLRSAYASSGWRGFRNEQIDWLVARQPTGRENAFFIATEYALLGDREKALEWLQEAYEWRRYHLAFLKADPRFDPLRGEPRFEDLLRRIGLPP